MNPTHKRQFETWLAVRGLGSGTIASRISNCERVEEFEGDLDAQFAADRLTRLLERLTYSTEDERFRRKPNHTVPIAGNIRNGSATLKSAVKLYHAFRNSSTHWPRWPQPTDEALFKLAQVLAPLVRFLNPAIIGAIAEDNHRHRAEWSDRLKEFGIDPASYLWDGSSCTFPGVRRYAGRKEISWFRKRSTRARYPAQCLALDDNDYPKHLWAFVFTGRPFRKRGPDGYQLAHLFDHKANGNRWQEELDIPAGAGEPQPLFGLFTSAANAAYLPAAFLRPTDFSFELRSLLQRRATALYGNVCSLLPPPLGVKACDDPMWRLERFAWSEPSGDMTHVPAFLVFRRERINELIGQRRAAG